MTNEEFQMAYANVLQAVRSGSLEEKTCYESDFRRVAADEMNFHLGYEYRLKPKPRELYIRMDKIGGDPKEVFFMNWENGAIKFREVIDE